MKNKLLLLSLPENVRLLIMPVIALIKVHTPNNNMAHLKMLCITNTVIIKISDKFKHYAWYMQ